MPAAPRSSGKRRRTRGPTPRAARTRAARPAIAPPLGSRRAAATRLALEVSGLAAAGMAVTTAGLGLATERFAGSHLWTNVFPFVAIVLLLGLVYGGALRGWLWLRQWLVGWAGWLPAVVGLALGVLALWAATRPEFGRQLGNVRRLTGGVPEAHRIALAHQVYAAYRRADLDAMTRMLERARVFETTVREAAAVFGVDPEVLMGIAAAESSFHPRDSRDGGRGLFQITAPPREAVAEARDRLGVAQLDPLNQRHNAFVAAATLRRYLAQMRGDPFLGLLAYNIGPRNGGLESIMRQYGARDFVTMQPYLQHLPRDYPIRVLSAALAYRIWRAEGRLLRYEEGENARHIQRLGIPLLTADG